MKDSNVLRRHMDALGDSRDKARRFHYKCLYPGCTKNSINSHLIQQHPFLESIAENGLLYQIKDNEIDPRSGDFSDTKELHLSIGQALSMPLFCSEHDNGLFKSIESKTVNWESVQTFLLFSLRGLASQRYLEEKRKVFYQYKSTIFPSLPFEELQSDYSKHIIERFDKTMGIMFRDIQSQSFEEYVYSVVEFPFLPICGSDVVVDENEMCESFISGNRSIIPLNSLFLSLLPFRGKDKLVLLIGYHKQFVSMRQKQFYQYVLSHRNTETIFQVICRMKNWCGNPLLFDGCDFVSTYEASRAMIILKEGGC